MADRIVINAALSLLTGPGEREWRAPVLGIAHPFGLEYEQDVDVRRKILERIPFLRNLEAFGQPPKTRELRIHHLHARLLLASVTDELAAEHRDIRICPYLRFECTSLRMKRVAGGVDPDEALAGPYRGDERLLPRRAHGRMPVSTGLGQVPGREEEERIGLGKVAVKGASILRDDDPEAVALPDRCERLLGKREVLALLHRLVLEAGRLGEDKDLTALLVPVLGRPNTRYDASRQRRRAKQHEGPAADTGRRA